MSVEFYKLYDKIVTDLQWQNDLWKCSSGFSIKSLDGLWCHCPVGHKSNVIEETSLGAHPKLYHLLEVGEGGGWVNFKIRVPVPSDIDYWQLNCFLNFFLEFFFKEFLNYTKCLILVIHGSLSFPSVKRNYNGLTDVKKYRKWERVQNLLCTKCIVFAVALKKKINKRESTWIIISVIASQLSKRKYLPHFRWFSCCWVFITWKLTKC